MTIDLMVVYTSMQNSKQSVNTEKWQVSKWSIFVSAFFFPSEKAKNPIKIIWQAFTLFTNQTI